MTEDDKNEREWRVAYMEAMTLHLEKESERLKAADARAVESHHLYKVELENVQQHRLNIEERWNQQKELLERETKALEKISELLQHFKDFGIHTR